MINRFGGFRPFATHADPCCRAKRCAANTPQLPTGSAGPVRLLRFHYLANGCGSAERIDRTEFGINGSRCRGAALILSKRRPE